ncbi:MULTISPECIES: hypothetical protein [unclassified Pseudoalteromonas]|jgi:hypothetical protein|uniref:hypothetical protein n=1 Tax=unclassified Pseudoalteromonas TaxID=194690 RepID=UPI0010235EBC|nr:hypothetical protein [Pseudoalteromonas sp. L1]RZF93536.1 hypothetical protein EXT42_06605 [Pseudoalteromonas sp. CO302Y]RZG10455.1 hypothetical protein EXT40_06615 [Pseudoalteromonas sp. CO133X]WOC24938.1 hypothetical protein LY624_09930 [Pseudoalteromonas sp. N1230-9]
MFNYKLNTEQQRISEIFQRLCKLCEVKNNTELENYLSLKSGFCEHCIDSATPPYEVIDTACKMTDTSFDFVLNGHNQNTMTLDGDLLQAVNNGIIKSIKKLSTAGLIKGDNQTQEALNQLAKIQVKQIENEIKIQSQIK